VSRLVLHHHFASAPSRLAPLVAWTVLGLLTAAPAWAAFTFELVVNRNTVVPNSAATFTGLGLPALEGENVTFKATDSAADLDRSRLDARPDLDDLEVDGCVTASGEDVVDEPELIDPPSPSETLAASAAPSALLSILCGGVGSPPTITGL